MKRAYTTLILYILSFITVFGQDDNHKLYGFSFSETDYEAADFFKMTPETGQIEVLSVAKGIGSFSIGASIYDDWRDEYLIWAQTANQEKNGYVFNPKNGELLRTIKDERPPADLQYDQRQRKIYGLRYAPNRNGIELIKVNHDNISTVATLKDIKHFSAGNTAFDSNRGLYIFVARNKENEERLYRVNTANGNILDEPIIDDYVFNELEYDLTDNKLYGIARKKSNLAQFFFVDINMLTAYPTIIRPVFGLKAIEIGLSAMSYKGEGRYIFVGKNRDEKTHLYQLDILEGFNISKIELNEKLSELHLNNSKYITDRYKDIVIEEDDQQNIYFGEKNDKRQLFTDNTVKNLLLFDELPFIQDKTVETIVYNVNGQQVLKQPIFLKDETITNQLDVGDLKAGIYIIKMKTQDKVYTQRFVKL